MSHLVELLAQKKAMAEQAIANANFLAGQVKLLEEMIQAEVLETPAPPDGNGAS